MTQQTTQAAPPQQEAHPNHNKVLGWTLFVVIGMFGFGFALVPLYDVFCDITGLNGKTTNTPQATSTQSTVDTSREITVQFVANTNDGMPWDFKPIVSSIKVHPGEMQRITFFAHNQSNQDIVGQAVPSVSPGLTAQYFKKTECFCFTEQPLKANESTEMPVVFMVDPEIPEQYKTLTLSYTLFNKTAFNNLRQQPVGRLNH